MEAAEQALSGPLGTTKILTAFSVSLTMNTMFAPIMMIAHKVADLHIAQYQGRLACLWNAPQTGRLLQSVDWNGFWKNVLCRSLLWFWIPVHTVTFLLPPSSVSRSRLSWERSWGCCWPCCPQSRRRPHSARRFPEGRTGAIPLLVAGERPRSSGIPILAWGQGKGLPDVQKSRRQSSPAGF